MRETYRVVSINASPRVAGRVDPGHRRRVGSLSGMEIRQISTDERTAAMFPLQQYAFKPSPWTADQERAYRERMPYFADVVSLVAEEEGQALACAAAFAMRQNVRGLVRDMAGVSSVATH